MSLLESATENDWLVAEEASNLNEEDVVLHVSNVAVTISGGRMTCGPDGCGTSSISPPSDGHEITLTKFGFFSKDFLNYKWEEHSLLNGPDNLDGTKEAASYYGYVSSADIPDACYGFDPSSHIMFMKRTVEENGWSRTCWIFSTAESALNQQIHNIIVSMLQKVNNNDDVTTANPPPSK